MKNINTQNPPQGSLIQFLKAEDDLEQKILKDTINMVVSLDLNNFLLTDKKEWESYFGHILDLTQSLFKSSSHRKKYIKTEEKFLEDFSKRSLEDPNKNIQLGTNPVDLNTEVDGFLTHLKATLDSLAKSLNPLLGIKLPSWARDKGVSGGRLLNSLNNLPAQQKIKAEAFIKFLEDNKNWITYLVFLRDSPNHHGGLKNITNIFFDTNTKGIKPQYIIHPDNQAEEVKGFLTRTLSEFTQFISTTIALSLLVKAPASMGIVRNEENMFKPYSLVILQKPESIAQDQTK